MEKKVYSDVERLFDRISSCACDIERLGWKLYRETENDDLKHFGAVIAELGSHINWWLCNSSDFDEYAEFVEKCGLN